MNNELHKFLDKLQVTAITKDMQSIPAREHSAKPWRVTLVRTVGRGKDAQELRLSTVMLSITRPLVHDIVTELIHDCSAGEQKLWDFAQTFTDGKADETAERLHYACAKTGKRVKRFFGEDWEGVTRAEQGMAPVAPATAKVKEKEKEKVKVRKSA